jgi:4,5:9,10-diseco-3-hydroxy-5,9,17-trioxoandrosta-1(10),2-diene-4-oate hydrolase
MLPIFQDHYTTSLGLRVRYWDEGAGTPVLLIHGLGAAAESWLPVVHPLAHRFRVVVPDLLGHGLSDKPSAPSYYTVDSAVRFVTSFMDSLGLSRAHLVGNSLGGLIVLAVAATTPDRVDRLVLAGPAGFGTRVNLILRLASLPLVGELMTLRVDREVVRANLRLVSYNRGFITDELCDRFLALVKQPGTARAYLTLLRQGLTLRGIRASLLAPLHMRIPSIKAPTLIIWGRHDALLPVSDAATAQRLLPHARVVIWEDCGHVPQLEYPERFAALVGDFLSEGMSDQRPRERTEQQALA